jgi:phospholipase/lecithinase/hemolysin
MLAGMNPSNARVLWNVLSASVVLSAWNLACAGPFTQLVVFGDSLADVGNIAQATLGIFPGPYYHNDRFSNGPVFVEALSVGLGLGSSRHSTIGGNNFAYGGAQTSGTGGINGLFIRDIDEQVDQFLATRTADASALYLVFAGSNDLVNGQTNVNIPIANLAEDIGRLVTAGARNFLVPNLPLLGHTPRFNDVPSTLATFNLRSTQFNTALDALLNNLQTNNSALTIFQLDVAEMFSEALADPARFGLTNVTDAAAPGLQPGAGSYDTNQIAANANQYVFWDDLHPTATVHAALASRSLALFFPSGDYNRDAVVDAADYVVWRHTLGQSGPSLAADGNSNNMVDSADYTVWRGNFGNSAAAAATVSLNSERVVPEASTRVLLLVALVVFALWQLQIGNSLSR